MTDKIPRIVVHPSAQAQIDANPKLAEMMREMGANMRNAMQGVVDGRYPDFDTAMEALTGARPAPADLSDPEIAEALAAAGLDVDAAQAGVIDLDPAQFPGAIIGRESDNNPSIPCPHCFHPVPAPNLTHGGVALCFACVNFLTVESNHTTREVTMDDLRCFTPEQRQEMSDVRRKLMIARGLDPDEFYREANRIVPDPTVN